MGLKSKPDNLYPPGEATKVALKQKAENARKAAEIQKEYEEKAPINYVERIREIDKVTEVQEIQSGKKAFKRWSFQELAKEKITKENPRLIGYPNLLNLFVEILFYRWSGKKKKDGYVQATINQISVGVQLTEEESNAVMLDDNPVQ